LEGETIFRPSKTTTQVKARVVGAEGLLAGLQAVEVSGYEIHMGQSSGGAEPAFQVIQTPFGPAQYFDGSVSREGWIFGSYLHGLFHNLEFTRILLNNLRKRRGLAEENQAWRSKDSQYDELAKIVRGSLDMERIYRITLGQ